MIDGIDARPNPVGDARIRPIFAMPLFVLHDVALLVERFLRHGAQQIGHAVAFHPQRHVERAARDRGEVIRPVLAGRAIHARRAGLGKRREELAVTVRRPLEHQVLEQVGEAGLAVWLVGRPHAIPHADEHRWHRVVAVHENREAIVQPEHLVRNIDLRSDVVVRSRLRSQQARGQNEQQSDG